MSHGEFDRRFKDFKMYKPADCELQPTHEPPERAEEYHTFKDSAKVRFMSYVSNLHICCLQGFTQ